MKRVLAALLSLSMASGAAHATNAWILDRQVDDFTDEAIVSAGVVSGRDTLQVICRRGQTHLLYAPSEYVGPDSTGSSYILVKWRVGKGEVRREQWRTLEGMTYTTSNMAMNAAKEIVSGGGSFVIRASGYNTVQSKFSTIGAKVAILEVAQACGWKGGLR